MTYTKKHDVFIQTLNLFFFNQINMYIELKQATEPCKLLFNW